MSVLFVRIKKWLFLYLHLVISLLCAIIIFMSNYTPEAVGPANNGDFLRVIHPNKISYVDNNPRKMWQGYGYTPEFVMSFGGGGGLLDRAVYFMQTDFTTFDFPSSQVLTIKMSKFLNLGFNMLTGTPLNNYNLFWLFIIHLGIFAYSIHLILGYIYRRFGMKMLVFSALVSIFILSDQGYTIYFNSFYGEALQYVLTLLAIGLLLRLGENGDGVLVYFIVVYLMATSKFAWIPVGIFFALAPLIFLMKSIDFPKGTSKKKLIAFSGATVCILLIFYALLIPSWIERDTNFNSVFNGVLRNSQTPEQDLERLGLDPAFAVLQGWEMYMDDYPIDIHSEEFDKAFFNVISKPKILMFYLNHPARFLGVLQESAVYTKYIRAPYLTSVQNPEYGGQQEYRFSIWENIRVNIKLISDFRFIVVVLGIAISLGAVKLFKNIEHKKSDPLPITLLFLSVSAAVSFVLPYISNGISDQAKQLFGFISLFDIILFSLLGCLVYIIDIKKIIMIIRNCQIKIRHRFHGFAQINTDNQ